MPLLLDTHVVLWLANEPERLSSAVSEKINSNEVLFLSYSSIWEISLKSAINKIALQFPLPEFVSLLTSKHSLQLLPITLEHIYHVNHLPLHHRDPFDRLLIAQSLEQKIDIVSSDAMLDFYDVKRSW